MEEIKNYKQIYEDLSTGKNLLLDYNNNQFECTKLGTKKPNYFREITGQDSYQVRLENGLITKIKYDKPNHYNPFSNRFLIMKIIMKEIKKKFCWMKLKKKICIKQRKIKKYF